MRAREEEGRSLRWTKALGMVVPGRRKGGRPKRWLDLAREDVVKVCRTVVTLNRE